MVYNVHAKNQRRAAAAAACRAWLNGREVTSDCFYADTRRGLVKLYLRDVEGRLYLTAGEQVAAVEKRGSVRVRRLRTGFPQ